MRSGTTGPGEDTAASIHAAFAQDGIVYEIVFHVTQGSRTTAEIASDVATVKEIISTVRPDRHSRKFGGEAF